MNHLAETLGNANVTQLLSRDNLSRSAWEATMVNSLFVVRWLKDGEPVSEQRFPELKDARAHAWEQIKLYRALGRANSAIVCDDTGATLLAVF